MGLDGKGTRRILSDYLNQVKMVNAQEALIQSMEAAAQLVPEDTKASRPGVSRPVEGRVLRLEDERAILESMRLSLRWRSATVNAYLNSIGDPVVRAAMALRYVNGLSWAEIAARQGGWALSEANVRMMVVRYVNKHPMTWLNGSGL